MNSPKIQPTQLTQTQANAGASPREANAAAKSRFLSAMQMQRDVRDGSPQFAPNDTGVPLHTLLSFTQSNLRAAVAPTPPPAKAPEHADLATLLEKACSAMYVGDGSANNQRVLLSLDPVLGGAAAEIVRNGAHLSIRLHARNDHAFRSMSMQREQLVNALRGGKDQAVDVEIVQVDGTGNSQSFAGGR